MQQQTHVLVQLGDLDAAIVPHDRALAIATALAQESGQIVRVRDATTDDLIATIKPR